MISNKSYINEDKLLMGSLKRVIKRALYNTKNRLSIQQLHLCATKIQFYYKSKFNSRMRR